MTTITIKKRKYTHDQAHYLLRHNGWVDDVNAFLATIPDGTRYHDQSQLKNKFRAWRRIHVANQTGVS